jgi:Ca-activated chloride channel family protein
MSHETGTDEAALTAYALGELPADERLRVEGVLATSADARREVEETRRVGTLLQEALSGEPTHVLTEAQRARVEAAAQRPARRRRVLRWVGGIAATILVATVVAAISIPSLMRARVGPIPPRAMGVHVPPPAVAGTRMSAEQEKQLRALGYIGDGLDVVAQGPPATLAFNTEQYGLRVDSPFVPVAVDPRSTFSVDVDTASYSIVRRFLRDGTRPPADAVRIEEMVNYFHYSDPPPDGDVPFAVHLDSAACPWKPEHRLVRIALKGREVPRGERPASNLVFLLDVSGSMDSHDKLPLVQAAMRLLVNELEARDRVAIVVYAGASGLVLPSTSARDKASILDAIDALRPGGGTQGSAGIELAYRVAVENYVPGGVNRVILATDGDFNLGVTNEGDLVRLIEAKAKSGVFLTALGVGTGNLKDSTLESLADHGNGHYAYLDSLQEARKVLVAEIGSTLVTIAKDVKLQLEFNPRVVKAHRLIGYENRVLAHQEFADDAKDAGEIGAGHTVTALYEVVPADAATALPGVDPLKYQSPSRLTGGSAETLTVKLRYKEPDGLSSAQQEFTLRDEGRTFAEASADFRFAASVVGFGMLLRESPHRGLATVDLVEAWASESAADDPSGQRAELVELVRRARSLGVR